MTLEGLPIRYQFLSIDQECEKWAQSSQYDADAPPCFDVLSQFYDELMVTTFPLEEERDDIEDWFQCFHFQMKQIRWKQQGRENIQVQELSDEEKLLLQGNATDVVIMIADNAGDNITSSAPKRQLDHQLSSFAGLYAPNTSDSSRTISSKPTIIGAAAVEYYKESRVGLLSYIVLHPDFRSQGLAAPLHKEALSRLTRLSSLYATAKECQPLLQAVFAETNTAAAGDVTPDQSLLRHKSLNKLGYRLVNFPYAQPPLSTNDVDASFDDLLLLVYYSVGDEVTEDHAQKYFPWHQNSSNTKSVKLDVSIPFRFVEDFYKSVFGYNSVEEKNLSNRDDIDGIPDYRIAKYYKLAEWFFRHKCNTGLVEVELCSPPWEDCKETLYLEMADWIQNNKSN